MKSKHTCIDDDLAEDVCSALDKHQSVKRTFPGWGRLHIDRQLPFLCIYIKPENHLDKGTPELILGQASYILVRERDANTPSFKKLLDTISQKLESLFGAFLFFEFWTTKPPSQQSNRQVNLHFDIKTSENNPPLKILEEMENALLDIDFNQANIRLSLDYDFYSQENRVQNLSISNLSSSNNQYWLGLAVNPIFRQGNILLPYEMRLLHAGLTRALRRTFFAFIRNYTNQLPTHFHELGHRSITPNVLDIDKKLAAVKDQFDILFHVTPVNFGEAWTAFSDSEYLRMPTFKYRPRPIDPDLLKRKLYAIEIEHIEDPTLLHIFQTQREETSRLLGMIADRNTTNFMHASMQVFGGVDESLLATARHILGCVAAEEPKAVKIMLTAQEFKERAQNLIADYQLQHPSFCYPVELRKDIPGVLVSNGKLMIGESSHFDKNKADATLAHEIGTHMVTYFNGCAQPFQQFYSGMQDHESLQEGLAVLAEYLVGKLYPNRLRTIAARVCAVHACINGADFIEVFRMLTNQFKFAPENAFQICMRVFRGGGLTKDAIYLKGLLELIDYLKKGGDLHTLFIGKIALKHLRFIEELKWRKMLKEVQVVPHFLTLPLYKSRIKRLKESESIIELVNGNEL
nr:tyrosine/phenylalanine carboxypeptidase domain-containing protein [uncultured Glaciecola sp.]